MRDGRTGGLASRWWPLSDIVREALPRDFRHIDLAISRVILMGFWGEGSACSPYAGRAEPLSALRARAPRRRVLAGAPVSDIELDHMTVGDRRIAVDGRSGPLALRAGRRALAEHEKDKAGWMGVGERPRSLRLAKGSI